MNLSNVFLVQFPNFSLSFLLLFQWLQLLPVQSYISETWFVSYIHLGNCINTLRKGEGVGDDDDDDDNNNNNNNNQ